MTFKRPIKPQQTRKVLDQFSWLDHRLVRDRYIDQCSHPAAALYLFLVTVSDARGLSYYSDPTVIQRLSMDEDALRQARLNLTQVGLIAYKKPLYQVLALDIPADTKAPTKRPALERPQSLGQILGQIMEDAS